jgi:hypothetical protein
MKNAVFWDVTPCGSSKNKHFVGIYRLHHHVGKIRELGTTSAVTSNPSTLRGDIVLMIEVIVPPKCRFLQEIHGVTSQKAAILMYTYDVYLCQHTEEINLNFFETEMV